MKVIGFAGYSGSGKTTLVTRVVPILVGAGLKVSVLKHAHHGFDVDQPGKDSHRFREAGAQEVLVGSGARWALMHELRGAPEPPLGSLIARLSPCDLVLVEGYKRATIPKIEVWRQATGSPRLWPDDRDIVAVASDVELPGGPRRLDIDRPEEVAAFLIAFGARDDPEGMSARKTRQ